MFSRPERPFILTLCLVFALNALVTKSLAQSSSSDSVEEYFRQGQIAISQGKYDQAEAAYEKLRELEPGMAEVHANLGLVYFQEKKFEQAVPALRQALKLKPTLPKAGTLLAFLYLSWDITPKPCRDWKGASSNRLTLP